ncbi:hypothetical protein [Roseomonas indoligenes]|uniref:Response regulatory domain-containing protein n=1 Tax=Roseomonas indoligenes TaxID=2820811 RepID=A0A940S9M2_9PROT|nr:hypothetical protein [Pararoseomonas indoligenes]MBP0495433.1 hypothetical protein [Pararoseomonas indoligenes]
MSEQDDFQQARDGRCDDGHDGGYAARSTAAADIAAGALRRNAPHAAFAALQEAARAALLALSHVPQRHTNEDLRFLTALASAPPDRFAGHPQMREAAVRDALGVLARLIPPVSENAEALAEPERQDRDERADRKLRVLVVEDDWLIAEDTTLCLEEAGFQVLGPVPTVDGALRLIEASAADGGINAAVLDFNLGGTAVTPVAKALTAIRVPFLYMTGYSAEYLSDRGDQALLLEKPVDADVFLDSLLTLGGMGQGPSSAASAAGLDETPGRSRLGNPGPDRVSSEGYALECRA